ncbi:uncharacterized protein FFE2_06492 [Fusarium fujikuroi]|nr:uncharacterized protein FFE2_06492 [Fusarium fujikuroi]
MPLRKISNYKLQLSLKPTYLPPQYKPYTNHQNV